MIDAHDDRQTDHVRPPIGRRRWLRYSLRGLFVLVIVAALPAWWIRIQLDGFAAEHEAIELLRRQGAIVGTELAEPEWLWKHFPGGTTPPRVVPGRPRPGGDAEQAGGRFARRRPGRTRRARPGGDAEQAGLPAKKRDGSLAPVPAASLVLREYATWVVLPGGNGDDEQMKLVGRFKHLRRLSAQAGRITNAGLANCAALRDLTNVDLDGCRFVTDDGLRHFRQLKKLEELRLNSTGVSDAGMAIIERLPALKLLFASDCNIGNSGLRHVARIESLEFVGLTGTRGDDDGVGELAQCAHLRRLWLPAGVTAVGLARLSSLSELNTLGITANGPTPLAPFRELTELTVRLDAPDDGTSLAEVKRLPKLLWLFIEGDGITDATLLSLAGFEQQCHISVTGGAISLDGVRALIPVLGPLCHLDLRESELDHEAIENLQLKFPAASGVTAWPKRSEMHPDPSHASPPPVVRRGPGRGGTFTWPPSRERGIEDGARSTDHENARFRDN